MNDKKPQGSIGCLKGLWYKIGRQGRLFYYDACDYYPEWIASNRDKSEVLRLINRKLDRNSLVSDLTGRETKNYR